MKEKEIKSVRKIEAFYNGDTSRPMPDSEIVDAFKYIIPAIQNEITDCDCRYRMNGNLEECKMALDMIAAMVSTYRFKTETGIEVRTK